MKKIQKAKNNSSLSNCVNLKLFGKKQGCISNTKKKFIFLVSIVHLDVNASKKKLKKKI